MKRGALYARVSTARQEQEQTIASQLAALESAATAAGVGVSEEHRYVDDGYSGSALNRPALDKLRDAAADGFLDVVFIHCPDRLARNFVHQQILIEELQKRGVEIHFVERPIGERPEDRMLVQMQGVIAEYERAKIVERTRRGKLHKIKTGQALACTNAPFGYAIVRTPQAPGGTLVIDEVEAQHVRAIYRWAHDEELPLAAIARRLNEMGVRPRRASHWSITSIWKILKNPTYTGVACYGKTSSVEPRKPSGKYRKSIKSSKIDRPRELWIEQPVPAIIDAAVQRHVCEVLWRNRVYAKRNVQHEYLLRRLVTCGKCGLRMAAQRITIGSGYFYYICRGRAQPEVTCRATRCTAPSIRSEQLDAVVWNSLVSWLKSPQMLREQISAWKESRQSKGQLAQEVTRLSKALRQVDAQIARLVDAYQAGAISIDELKARREKLHSLRDATRANQQQLQAEELSRDRTEQIADDISAFAATLTAGIENLDFAGRERIVRLLVERVVLTDDNVTIEHVVPFSGRFYGLRSSDGAPRENRGCRASEQLSSFGIGTRGSGSRPIERNNVAFGCGKHPIL